MKHGSIEVAFNAGRSEVRLPVKYDYEAALASTPDVAWVGSELRLPAGSVAVMRDVAVIRDLGAAGARG
jgi:hypothetical protein